MLSNGEAHRPLVHCQDIAAGFSHLCESDPSRIKKILWLILDHKMQILKLLRWQKKLKIFLEIVTYQLVKMREKDTRDYAVSFQKVECNLSKF